MSFISILFWSLFATVLACVEIESEGQYGWAERAPTWFRTTGLPARLYGLVMGGKPLTGYHMFIFFLPVFIFHAHFAMGMEWSVAEECKAWAMYFAWCVMWDYHWFVLNPHYTGKFSRDQIWWHTKSYWVLGLFPVDYFVGVGMSIGLAALGGCLNGGEMFIAHMDQLAGFTVYTVGLYLFAPHYHSWYRRMRLRDDRNKVNIFHK